MTIKEGNSLIAAFIGLQRGWWIHQSKPLTDNKKQWCDCDGILFLGDGKIYYTKDLLFHESWDWLMIVVKKIAELKGRWNTHHTLEYLAGNSWSTINDVYISVVDYIKEHNNAN